MRKPFLGGENVSSEEVEADSEVRSYDFHSVEGKIEHSHVTNYYFHGIINEKWVTGCLNWAAWLIIIVLIGNTVTYNRTQEAAPSHGHKFEKRMKHENFKKRHHHGKFRKHGKRPVMPRDLDKNAAPAAVEGGK